MLKGFWKQCKTCKNWTPISEFSKCGKYYRNYCNICHNKKNREYYKEHVEERREYSKEYYKEHAEEKKESHKKYRKENSEEIKKYQRKYYKEHTKEIKKSHKKYYKEHIEEIKEYRRKFRKKYEKKRRKEDPMYRLNSNMSNLINQSLKSGKNGNHWEDLVGFTINDLKSHLEKQFKDGMAWDNKGRNGWHLDHIRPVSSFNFLSYNDPEFKQCWSLYNLQPLWEYENISKGSKWEEA